MRQAVPQSASLANGQARERPTGAASGTMGYRRVSRVTNREQFERHMAAARAAVSDLRREAQGAIWIPHEIAVRIGEAERALRVADGLLNDSGWEGR